MASHPLDEWRAKPSVLSREVDGEFVIYDPDSDAVHTLNSTARFIWEHSAQPVDQIADLLCRRYSVARDTAIRDVERVLEVFKTRGLLRETSSP